MDRVGGIVTNLQLRLEGVNVARCIVARLMVGDCYFIIDIASSLKKKRLSVARTRALLFE